MLDEFITIPSFNTESSFVYRVVSARGDTSYLTFTNMEIKAAPTSAVRTYGGNFVHEEILLKSMVKNKKEVSLT